MVHQSKFGAAKPLDQISKFGRASLFEEEVVDPSISQVQTLEQQQGDTTIDIPPAVSALGAFGQAISGISKPAKDFLDKLSAVGEAGAQSFETNLLGAQQGINPRMIDQLTVAPKEEQDFFAEIGNVRDARDFVVLPDAQGNLTVFNRIPEIEETGFETAARVIAPGILGTPQTGRVATQAARDISTLGVEPSLLTASTNRAVNMVSSFLKDTFTGQGPITRGAKEALAGAATTSERIAGKLGTGQTIEDAAVALREGAETFVSKFTTKSGKLLEKVSDLIPGETAVNLTKTTEQLSETVSKFEGLPNIQRTVFPETFRGFLDDFTKAGDKMTFQQLRNFRSFVGVMQRDNSAIPDVPKQTWKNLYGALSEDMKVAAEAAGPEALQAFNRHNKFFSGGAQRIEGALSKLLDPKTTDGGLFTQVRLATQAGKAGQSAAKIRAIKRSLPKDDWDTVVSSLWRSMGQQTAGREGAEAALGGAQTFSPSKLLTEFNKMSPQARDAVFGGTRFAKMKPQVEALLRFADREKELANLANVSRTAPTGANIGLGALGLIDVVTFAKVVVGSFVTSKLISSPGFLKVLNGALSSESTLPQLISRMNSFANSLPQDNPLKEDVKQYTNVLIRNQNEFRLSEEQ